MTSAAETIVRQAFSEGRTPRSPEYRAGARSALAHWLEGRPIAAPYPVGTAEADAWLAGLDEGRALWRQSAMASEAET